jgi:hypothetical protein
MLELIAQNIGHTIADLIRSAIHETSHDIYNEIPSNDRLLELWFEYGHWMSKINLHFENVRTGTQLPVFIRLQNNSTKRNYITKKN